MVSKSELQNFKKNNSFTSQNIKSIKEYCTDTFFHKVVNRSLRKFSHPKQYFFLAFPISTLSSAIKANHQKTIDKLFKNKKTVILYRGCLFSEDEISDLEANCGEYIELQGYTSTSLKEEVAWNFYGNLLM